MLVEYLDKETFFVADFYSAESKLIVEIDGKIHMRQKERDALRTFVLNERGLRVVRFSNEEIEEDLQGVLGKLKANL